MLKPKMMCRSWRGAAWSILILGGVSGSPAHAGSTLQTLVLSIGGQSTDSNYGPPPGFFGGLFFNSGVGIPSVGLAQGDVAGSYRIQTALASPLSDSIALGNTTFNGGIDSFAGMAHAKAQYGEVGAAASATFNGPVDPNLLSGAEGYGIYRESMTMNGSPTHANGTVGYVQYQFSVDGTLTGNGSDVEINYQQTRGNSTADYLLMRAGIDAGGSGFLNTANTSSPSQPPPSGFTITPTSVGGSGLFDTVTLPFTYGTSFDFTFGLLAIAAPPSGSTDDANFGATARLSGINVFDASGGSVTDFSITSGSGTHYGANGVELSTVPEPGSLVMTLIGAGLASFGLALRRRLC